MNFNTFTRKKANWRANKSSLKSAGYSILKITLFLLFFVMGSNSIKAGGTITDGNTTFTWTFTNFVNPGIYSWQIQTGGTVHGFQHWFWYRVNGSDSREFMLPLAATSESFVGNVATLNWTNVDDKGFDAQVVLTLTELAPNVALISSVCSITNATGSLLDIEIFAQIDHDINPSFGTNVATLLSPGVIQITDPSSTDIFFFTSTGSNAFEVGNPNTLSDNGSRPSLADGSITSLTNTGLPFGPGDFNVAYSWNFQIPNGETRVAAAQMQANQPPASIPTMGEWGLIFLSLLILTFGLVAIRSPKLVLAAGANTNTRVSFRQLPFDKALFGKVLLPVALIVFAIFTVAISAFGYEMTSADIPGSLFAVPVLAYMIHLVIMKK